MGEKNGDAKAFWMELEDDGKVEFIFEKVQNVLQSLKQKIKMCLAQITSLSKPSFQ
jgi:histone-lysine N-methyltransferase SETDB2